MNRKFLTNPWAGFAGLVIISFALRIFKLNQGLWYDEIFTLFAFIRSGWKEIITGLPVPNNHILFSLLAKLSITIFGEKEWSLRLPSLILGGLTPPIIFLLLRDWVKNSTAFLTSIFLSLHFWMVWFSQDARGYAGWILFSFLSCFFFLNLKEEKNKKTTLAYLITSIIACYFHLYGIFLLTSQLLFAISEKFLRKKSKRSQELYLPIIALIISVILYFPGAGQLWNFYLEKGKETAGRWLEGYFWKELIKMLSGSHLLTISALFLLIFLGGLRQLKNKAIEFGILYLLSAGLILAFTLIFRVFIYPRFLSFFIPFYLLGIGLGIEEIYSLIQKKKFQLPARMVHYLLIAFIFFSLSWALIRYYHLGKQGFKKASIYIQKHYPFTPVISLGLAEEEFLYYLPRAQPVPGRYKLLPQNTVGKLIVASHPWSWAPYNLQTIEKYCTLEKVWESAGYKQNAVYLYRCF